MKRFCITFAGAIGSGKTPIAHYLSTNLSLPILNNDVIRTEVLEDLGVFDQKEYEARRDQRVKAILDAGQSFIYDASVDREWGKLKGWLMEKQYGWFVISLDFDKEFLANLYATKGYDFESSDKVDQNILDHENFVAAFGEDVGGRIKETDFKNRLVLTLGMVQDWLGRE